VERGCVRAGWLTHNSLLLCLDLHLEALEGHALRVIMVALSALRRDLHDGCCVEQGGSENKERERERSSQ
jgi:hypothetical protein